MENIEEIYKQYANLIKKYIFFITKNEDLSEEIMQETFVVAIKQINNFGFIQLLKRYFIKK